MGEQGLPPATAAPEGTGNSAADASASGEFVGAITHALKGLLNGLDGGVYLMESGRRKGDPGREGQGLEMVKRNGARLRNMIGGVLYYARGRTMDPQPVELGDAVGGAVRAVSLSARPAGVELVTDVQGGAAQADPTALQALLVDLLEHSVDACADQGDRRVHLLARSDGDGILLEVSHRGAPLDEENRARVLSPHYVARGGDRSVLWAFAAHRAAAMHGGRFEIAQLPEGGNLFRVVLPAGRRGEPQ